MDTQRKINTMCIPEATISKDGKCFAVLRGGAWWEVWETKYGWYAGENRFSLLDGPGFETIMEAVDNALAKIAQADKPKG
jgi:hypothetical protein